MGHQIDSVALKLMAMSDAEFKRRYVTRRYVQPEDSYQVSRADVKGAGDRIHPSEWNYISMWSDKRR